MEVHCLPGPPAEDFLTTGLGTLLLTCQAACAGLGIAILPSFIADRPLASGELVQILPDQPIAALEVTAVYPRAATPSVARNTLVDVLVSGSPGGERRSAGKHARAAPRAECGPYGTTTHD